MSVKFDKETFHTTAAAVDAASKGNEDLMHEIGNAITKGGGPNGYLAAYLKQLQSNPLRTKMLTSGTLSGLQEFLASWIAHDRSKSGHYFTSRVPKMAIYGAFISAPLGHVLISALQKVFQGRKSLKAKILQILASNLIIAPIQNSVYLISMALIAGARTFHQVRATVKAGFWPVMKVSWIVSPISLAFAQQFLPETTWVPFFNIIGFIIGTYINAHTKKKRLAALRRKHYGEGGGRSSSRPGSRPGSDPYLRFDRDLGWNMDWAVAFVIDRLEQSWADAAASLRGIRLRTAALYQDGLNQEIPLYIFHKLDRLLFAGHLKNAVFLNASSLSASVSGITYTHRQRPNPKIKRFSIILNCDVLQNGQPRDIVAMLIHHMIHAYFLVACSGQKETEVFYGRLAHGVHFGKIMLTIRRLSAAHGKELACLDYRHRLPGIQHFADEYHHFWRRDGTNREDKNAWYHSHCHCDVQGPSESEVDTCYRKACKPMFDQPHSVRKLEVQVSVEFLFREKPVLVERDEIKQSQSVLRAFDRAEIRFLKVHRDVSEDTFMRFLEFLHTGSYRPDPRSFAPATVVAGLDPDYKGPPIIRPQSAFTEAAVVLADVQFAKLSRLMGFDDCKSYALDRMDAYGMMYEGPVAVLKEIYRGGELDSNLKAWACKFLIRTPARSSPFCHHNNLIGQGTMELPNLLELESHYGPYRSRFLDAVDSNEALEMM
ncbi:hypothetical protein yc1106_09079 [Curvularia clavata]|uniref:SprT-like domain-containing protein n=1 Tax=Curvularia clavata TaxID=95742 RepID=A0A9Q9DXC3_CURCL|nr:hypothetical protein yc1106_09079 [Curvularia clavata]